MGWTSENLTPEQQELLDSGLRMLAHMIAKAHLRRMAALKETNRKALPLETVRTEYSTEIQREPASEDQPESNDE